MKEKLEKSDLLIDLYIQMNKSLKEIIQKLSEHTNTHETFAFSTAGLASFHKDIHELLSLPRGYYASSMTIFDIGVKPAYAIEQTIEAMRKISTAHCLGTTMDGKSFEMWMKINPETGKNDYFQSISQGAWQFCHVVCRGNKEDAGEIKGDIKIMIPTIAKGFPYWFLISIPPVNCFSTNFV